MATSTAELQMLYLRLAKCDSGDLEIIDAVIKNVILPAVRQMEAGLPARVPTK